MEPYTNILVDTPELLASMVSELDTKTILAIDTETTGLNTTKGYDNIVGISLAQSWGRGFYIPVRHTHALARNLEVNKVIEALQYLIRDDRRVVMQNSLYDYPMLTNDGLVLNWDNIDDTMVSSFVIDCNLPTGLKEQALRWLGYKMTTFDEVTGKARSKFIYSELATLTASLTTRYRGTKGFTKLAKSEARSTVCELYRITDAELDRCLAFAKEKQAELFAPLDPADCYHYASDDARCTWELWRVHQLDDNFIRQANIYGIERDCLMATHEMQSNRVLVNVELATRAMEYLTRVSETLEVELQGATGIANLNSSSQLGKFFFGMQAEEYDTTWGYTDSGAQKCDTEVMQGLSNRGNEIAKQVVHYKSMLKQANDFLGNMLHNLYPDNTIKFGYRQLGTKSGRYSSTGGKGLNPIDRKGARISPDGYGKISIQQYPFRALGGMLTARKGYKILMLDQSQQEPRIVANISKDANFIRAMQEAGDAHRAVGSMIFNKPPAEITKLEREIAKLCGLASLYGISSKSLASKLSAKMGRDVKSTEAQGFLDAYFTTAYDVGELQRECHSWVDLRSSHFDVVAVTLFGRERPLYPLLDPAKFTEHWHKRSSENNCKRICFNNLIQGTAGDFLKMALPQIVRYLYTLPAGTARLIGSVHDSIFIEVREEYALEVGEAVKLIMEARELTDSLGWVVPFEVDMDIFDSLHKGYEWNLDNLTPEETPAPAPQVSKPTKYPVVRRANATSSQA